MVVRTQTERVEKCMEALKLLLVNHPLDCPVCDAGGMPASKPHYEFGIEQNEFPVKRDIPQHLRNTPDPTVV
jgi:predicted molibdopterin-dependent oxidoreductase YjgC